MPQLDSTAAAALDAPVIAPAFFLLLDVDGDPIRATTFGADRTFAGTGDPDLDGHTFHTLLGAPLEVGDVMHQEGGSDTLSISLSGIVTIDTDLLAGMADRANWQGRKCRLWFQLFDEANAPLGAIVPYYTGYMSSLGITPSPTSQTINLTVDHYLSVFNDASNRSYMNQADYDPTDISASGTLAAANGTAKKSSNRPQGPYGIFMGIYERMFPAS